MSPAQPHPDDQRDLEIAREDLEDVVAIAAELQAEARQQALRALSDLLAVWSAKHPGVQLGPVQAGTGEALAALLAATHDAQLVAVGTPAHAEPPDPLAGTVGRALIERAGCSVAITPAR